MTGWVKEGGRPVEIFSRIVVRDGVYTKTKFVAFFERKCRRFLIAATHKQFFSQIAEYKYFVVLFQSTLLPYHMRSHSHSFSGISFINFTTNGPLLLFPRGDSTIYWAFQYSPVDSTGNWKVAQLSQYFTPRKEINVAYGEWNFPQKHIRSNPYIISTQKSVSRELRYEISYTNIQ